MRTIYLAGLAATVLAGCSTASYQKPVAALSDSISAAKTAFNALSEEERKDYVTLQIRDAVEDGKRIAAPTRIHCPPEKKKAAATSEGRPAQIDCRPTIYDPRAKDKEEKPIEVNAAAPKLLKLADALDSYGTGLGQLAAAQDIAALKDAVAKAGAGAATLATTVGGPAIGAAAGATLDFVEWLVGAYLDAQRFRELRHIVEATDPSVAIATKDMAQVAELMKGSIARKRMLDVHEASNTFSRLQNAGGDKAKTEAAGEAFVSGALDLQAFLETDVTDTLNKVRDGHAKLLESLKHPEIDPAAVYAALDALRTKVTAMRDAFVKLGAKK